MSGMLFSDRQKFIYCYVMMLYDINYFVTGKAKVNGKMTDKFGFFSDIFASYVANPAAIQVAQLLTSCYLTLPALLQ